MDQTGVFFFFTRYSIPERIFSTPVLVAIHHNILSVFPVRKLSSTPSSLVLMSEIFFKYILNAPKSNHHISFKTK